MKHRALIAGGLVLTAVAAGAFFMRSGDNLFEYQGHRIPLDQLRIVDPHPGCDYVHYHAIASKSVSTTDGTKLSDESDCGYGRVD